MAHIVGFVPPQPKEPTFRQPATAEAIRDLCARHLAPLEEMLAHPSTATPRCRWEPEHQPRPGHLAFGLGERRVTVRDCLEHDHRCRSATALLELATACFRMADELSRTHRKEVADLRRQMLSMRRCTAEWDAAFGRDASATPAAVAAELRSLRLQVRDLVAEKAASAHQHKMLLAQHDALVHQHIPSARPRR